MARSQSKPSTSANQEVTEAVVEAAFWAAWKLLVGGLRLVWWAALFPMLSLPVLGAGLVAYRYDWKAGTAVAVAAAVTLIGWRLASPGSFRRLVKGRLWRRWRRWIVYRRPWPSLCALHGLNDTLNGQVVTPRLYRVNIGYQMDTLNVKLLYGQHLNTWEQQAEALAHAFGALSVRVDSPKPSWVQLTVLHTEALATPIRLPPPDLNGVVDLARLPVGRTETGQEWRLRILGRHVLVAGATGAGKGSVIWSVLTAAGPAVADGWVQIWVIDPKGGMELGPGHQLFSRFAPDPGEGALSLLRDAAQLVTERAARLRGVTRQHTPSVTEPFVLVVIDEIASLTAYGTDRKQRNEIEQLLGLILSQGRAVGVSVLAAVQDPSKDVLPLRQLFPTRIGLRLSEASQTAMILGDGAKDRGGRCDLIPDSLPGVGYVAHDEHHRLIRVRAFHVTDSDIPVLAHRFRPPTPDRSPHDDPSPRGGQ
jgi:DNA segregation ATPase FtsK/SpoIIIE, S-DNA-T family